MARMARSRSASVKAGATVKTHAARMGRVGAIRKFNRFYTRKIGVLQEGFLGSAYSLAQGRVLYELAHREKPTAAVVGAELGLDAGYVSRILRGFKKDGLIRAERSQADGRETLLSLTPLGRKVIATLDRRSNEDVSTRLRGLPEAEQQRLVTAMDAIESVLAPRAAGNEPYILRPHQPGDLGWVVGRQGLLYAQEYGWDEQYEALAAKIVAKFIERFDVRRERCWVAERRGEAVGAVFLVKHSQTVAKLRLLHVESSARGLGIGKRLVDECVRFARRVGYKKITLWTQSILSAARRIYKHAGFRCVGKKRHHSFGHDLVAETWELKL
jgi:DNA-binding MarR family transcriptional regulator/N-acetylglutamate synthase-like GNAT family acetyltransferase